MPVITEKQEKLDKVKVAVRLRPLNRREIELATSINVDMEDGQTILYPSSLAQHGCEEARTNAKVFAFDYCFWSIDASNSKYASQEKVFEGLGLGVLENAFLGYNACIVAYGQTGSGKSYTMMGNEEAPGIIPRLCDTLFKRIQTSDNPDLTYKVEVSYMEIYNEKVHDLLDAQGHRKNLRVREHTILGPYVDGLSQLVVTSYEDIDKLMSEGNKSRTVAATNMNNESSRSHAVFNVTLTQTLIDHETQTSGEKVSKMSLVDLAGSERAQKTGASGDRLREGCNINKSLTTLMLVISALADSSVSASKGGRERNKFVPYRDSVLTWLLKDNLGGNSKTVMIATLSPAADNYEETLSTLRYADRAKRIENHAVVNEDPNAKIIRELREELDHLRHELTTAKEMQAPELKEKLEESEMLMREASKTWEEKLIDTERRHKERHEAWEKMGISVETSGIKVEQNKYFLVNLNADPSLNELLVYYIKDRCRVGSNDDQDIQLQGYGIQGEHCLVEVCDGEVFFTPMEGARTLVNGQALTERTPVRHKDRILWGMHHFFRLNCPKQSDALVTSITAAPSAGKCREQESDTDYHKAQNEVMLHETNNDPLQQVMRDLEHHHANEMADALARQRDEFERQLNTLRSQVPLSAVTAGIDGSGHNILSASMRQLPPATGGTPGSAWPSMMSLSGSQPNLFAAPQISQSIQARYQEWTQEREQMLKQSLNRLREQVAKANAMVREANFLADEMQRNTEYNVTLQIPTTSLSPNGKRGGIISEPAIQVKRPGRQSQIWSMDKLDTKVVLMRELYDEWKEATVPVIPAVPAPSTTPNSDEPLEDPFFDSQEDHSLIGVANVYLRCLFHKIKFRYQVPIINQQGEISGKLLVDLSVFKGELPDPVARDGTGAATGGAETVMATSTTSWPSATAGAGAGGCEMSTSMSAHNLLLRDASGSGEGPPRSASGYSLGSSVTIRVRVLQATHLPPHLSHFVFCQYQFWGETELTVVPPVLQPDFTQRQGDNVMFKFSHTADYNIPVTDDLVEHLAEDALSIEVYGNRSSGFVSDAEENTTGNGSPLHNGGGLQGKQAQGAEATPGCEDPRRFGERWLELYRRLELWVAIEELNDQGQYQKVEVAQFDDVLSGGIFQLRHGQSRRVRVFVRPNRVSKGSKGSLPLICDSIRQISMGCIQKRTIGETRKLDSYQEEDLTLLRDAWSEAVRQRQDHLKDQLQKVVNKAGKTSADEKREQCLMSQWMHMTAERDAVLVPAPSSGIPGAPANWSPPPGMEHHCPVLFLNIKAEEMAPNNPAVVASGLETLTVAGLNCLLPEELGDYVPLAIVKRYETMIGAVAQWDASFHDSILLNRVTPPNERIYMVVKVVVRLSHPACVDLVLRKRICLNIFKKQGLTDYLKKQWNRYVVIESDSVFWSGVTYQIVASIPQASLDIESRESLAEMAAGQGGERSVSSADQESYIEKYIRSVSAVESLLQLDRLRQEVVLKEMLSLSRKRRSQQVGASSGAGSGTSRGPSLAMRPGMPRLPSDLLGHGSVSPLPRVNGGNAEAAVGMGSIRRYISVPDLEGGMLRSFSLTSLNATGASSQGPSTATTTNATPTPIDAPQHQTGSPVDLRPCDPLQQQHPLDPLIRDPGHSSSADQNKVAPLLRRPQPSKALLLAAQNPLISPLSMGNLGPCLPPLSRCGRPSMGPLEEERIRRESSRSSRDAREDVAPEVSDDQQATVSRTASQHTPPDTIQQETTTAHAAPHNPTEDAADPNGDTDADATVNPSAKHDRDKAEVKDNSHSTTVDDSRPEFHDLARGSDSSQATMNSMDFANCQSHQQPSQEVRDANCSSIAAEDGDSCDKDGQELSAHMNAMDSSYSLNADEDWRSVIGTSCLDLSSVMGGAPAAPGENSLECSGDSTVLGGPPPPSQTPTAGTAPAWLQVDQPVLVLPSSSAVVAGKGNKVPGWVRFVGETKFAPGVWVGVELEQAEGKNDGTIQDVRYFRCKKRHGIFVRPEKLKLDKRRQRAAAGPPSAPATNSSGSVPRRSEPGQLLGKLQHRAVDKTK